jgi:HK97 family phage portal protein
MKWFGRKSAGRADARPVLARGWSTAVAERPWTYEDGVRAGYVGNPIVQRAVRLIAEGVAAAPLTGTVPEAVALVRTRTAGQGLLETLAMQLLLHGNGFVRVMGGGAFAGAASPRSAPAGSPSPDGRGNFPSDLFALRPERVTVERDAQGWPVAYLYRAGASVQRIAAEDAAGRPALVHLRFAHPLDDHYGLGCLGAAAGAVAIHNAATKWNQALLDNAARPSGALVFDRGGEGDTLAPEQFERLRSELDAQFSGSGNAGRPLLLEGGLKWQALSLTPADMDCVGLKSSAAREIALAFGVPPMLLGLPGDAAYANYKEANRALWRQAILPLAGVILGGINEALVRWWPEGAVRVDLDHVAALADERAGLWAQVTAADFLSRAEKRKLLGVER